jgi:hypothetical protein
MMFERLHAKVRASGVAFGAVDNRPVLFLWDSVDEPANALLFERRC